MSFEKSAVATLLSSKGRWSWSPRTFARALLADLHRTMEYVMKLIL